MRKIHVGMWCCDTMTNQNLSIQSRIKMLEDELHIFRSHCQKLDSAAEKKQRGLPAKRKIKRIFLAPENLFCRQLNSARPPTYDDVRQLSEGERDMILRELRQLSREHPETLLIPGSISWKKPINRPTGTDRKWWHQVASPNPFAALSEPKATRLGKSIARIHDNAQMLSIGLADALSGDYAGTPAKTSNDKLNELANATHIAKNTCYVLLNGRVMLKYNKVSDFHEVLTGPATVFVPGEMVARFRCDDLLFSLDICMDNAYERIQEESSPVDIHVLVSAATEGEIGNTNLKNGGWFLHCSSRHDYYCFRQNNWLRKGGDDIRMLSEHLRASTIDVIDSDADRSLLVEQQQAFLTAASLLLPGILAGGEQD
ncbi:hypothetical protein [Pseudomonas sp. NPDC089534]|uniref:hypothetical protein n=1 Tax=Pseudomonas sp. NPDC089534 TaxID=3364468 RepID=UPI0038152962